MKRHNEKASLPTILEILFHRPLLLVLLLPLAACYQPVQDCLDINATNFNANADDPCPDDCCTYPSLSFTINHLMGDANLSYDSVFYDIGSPDSIRLVKIAFYLSEVEVFGTDTLFTITERLRTTTEDGASLLLTDDFTLVEFNQGRTYTLGTYQTTGKYDRFLVRLGLRNEINEVNPLLMTTGHALSIQADSMWRAEEGYALAQVSLVTQANNTDTLHYFIPTLDNSILMGGFSPLNIDFGENASIGLDVNYLKWLAGIDFVAIGDNHDLVVAEIVSRLPESISASK